MGFSSPGLDPRACARVQEPFRRPRLHEREGRTAAASVAARLLVRLAHRLPDPLAPLAVPRILPEAVVAMEPPRQDGGSDSDGQRDWSVDVQSRGPLASDGGG